jgi:organic radical activating enzyme
MKEIVSVESNISADILRIELFLSNVCNYSCWYCFPGFHEGDVRWPKFEQVVDNLSYVIDYYKTNLNKKQIHLHIIGGEPTLWKDFGKFVKHFSEEKGCVISMSSNGSRTLRWWDEYGHYVNHVMLSCHHERVDPAHISAVGDILYKKDRTVNGMVLMDPNHWDKCVEIVEELKKSKYLWPITTVEVHHELSKYTIDQKTYLSKAIKRYPEINYWLRSEKISRSNPSVTYSDGTTQNIKRNWLSLNGYNYFKDWECNIGIDTFFIDKNGDIRGGCGQSLYNLDRYYNIYHKNFVENFKPEIIPTICKKQSVCDCQPETNARKRKIIPIVLS